MITVLSKGTYRLIETRGNVKILSLGDRVYAWIFLKDIGEILVASHNPHKTDHVLATGIYRLYAVDDQPWLPRRQQLELNVGARLWQGYLLPAGLPTGSKKRSRIIPTKEVFSCRRKSMVG